jgi:hypothetical protein
MIFKFLSKVHEIVMSSFPRSYSLHSIKDPSLVDEWSQTVVSQSGRVPSSSITDKKWSFEQNPETSKTYEQPTALQ